MSRIFIDTNILVYALDKNAGQKHEIAKTLLEPFFLSTKEQPVISAQVLHEFSNRLYRWEFSDDQVETLTEPMTYWNVVANDLSLFRYGLTLKKRYMTSFWDSLILAAAITAGVEELWSEDFHAGQSYEGVTVVNPFEKVG